MFMNSRAVVDAGLQLITNLHLPALLLVAVTLLAVRQLSAGDFQMRQDDSKRGTVLGLAAPALLNQQLVAFGTGNRNGKLRDFKHSNTNSNQFHDETYVQRIISNSPNDGRRVEVFVGNFARQELPEDDAEAPDVDLLRARLVADYFWRHPSDSSSKAHLRADVVELPRCTEIADFYDFVLANQNVRRLQVSMDDFMVMQVLHADGDLLRPRNDSGRRDDLRAFLEDLMQRPIRAELHDYAKNWRLSADSPENIKS